MVHLWRRPVTSVGVEHPLLLVDVGEVPDMIHTLHMSAHERDGNKRFENVSPNSKKIFLRLRGISIEKLD